MYAAFTAFPRRPLKLHAPVGILGFLVMSLGVLAIVMGFVAWLTHAAWPSLATDFAVRDKAVPRPAAKVVDVWCVTRLFLVQDCRATVVAPVAGGETRRVVHILFVEPARGRFAPQAMADPARPELLTTDLSLSRFVNRVISLGVTLLVALGLIVALLAELVDRVRMRAKVKELSGHVLTPVILDFRRIAGTTWHYDGPDGHSWTFEAPRGTLPFVLDDARGMVLGVSAEGAHQPLPLDQTLSWVALTQPERLGLLRAQAQMLVPVG